MTRDDKQEWLTVVHAAYVYDRPAECLIGKIKAGDIVGYRDGRPWMLNKESADQYFAKLAAALDTRTPYRRELDERQSLNAVGARV